MRVFSLFEAELIESKDGFVSELAAEFTTHKKPTTVQTRDYSAWTCGESYNS